MSTNEEEAFHWRRVCSSPSNNRKRMSPSLKVDLHIHAPPQRKRQKYQLVFIMQIPPPSSCLYNSALLMLAAWRSQRPGSKRKKLGPAVKHKSHLTDDLL